MKQEKVRQTIKDSGTMPEDLPTIEKYKGD